MLVHGLSTLRACVHIPHYGYALPHTAPQNQKTTVKNSKHPLQSP